MAYFHYSCLARAIVSYISQRYIALYIALRRCGAETCWFSELIWLSNKMSICYYWDLELRLAARTYYVAYKKRNVYSGFILSVKLIDYRHPIRGRGAGGGLRPECALLRRYFLAVGGSVRRSNILYSARLNMIAFVLARPHCLLVDILRVQFYTSPHAVWNFLITSTV